jgi:peptidoglycan/xylan/chitin deacetylase (PgdA/CDA1 family)
MIVGMPENGDYPKYSHSSYVIKGDQVNGGLVDGPVYSTIFRSHSKYITMVNKDVYADVQPALANYHDDITDYTSNECTMDGTACLVYYLSAMQNKSKNIYGNPAVTILKGAVVRMDTKKKDIYLCFTAHEFTDGFSHVTRTLKDHKIKASFFFTGDFCRTPANRKITEKLKTDGHYIGAHSDKHLLYCSWENRDSLLVTKNEFLEDLKNNYKELDRLGIPKNKALIFLPPYEWYNDSIAVWTREAGLKLVNNSSGTITNQDWTFPEKGKPYFSSDSLMKNFLSYEKNKGMNGYIMLIHPGTDPRRTDKFYLQLDSVLKYLESKNYSFHSFSEVN